MRSSNPSLSLIRQVMKAENQADGEQLAGFHCFYCASSPLVSMLSQHRLHKMFPRSTESIGAALVWAVSRFSTTRTFNKYSNESIYRTPEHSSLLCLSTEISYPTHLTRPSSSILSLMAIYSVASYTVFGSINTDLSW